MYTTLTSEQGFLKILDGLGLHTVYIKGHYHCYMLDLFQRFKGGLALETVSI